MSDPIQVEVVSPEGIVWEGESTSVSVYTVEGSLGVMSGHEPLLTLLAPHAAEIVTVDGRREVIAVSGGFMSVFENRLSILTDHAVMAQEISVEEARRGVERVRAALETGEATDENQTLLDHYEAQLKAAQKYSSQPGR